MAMNARADDARERMRASLESRSAAWRRLDAAVARA